MLVASFLTAVLVGAAPNVPAPAAHAAQEPKTDPLADGIQAYLSGDYAAAYALLAPLAEGGPLAARAAVGKMLARGWGVEADPARGSRLVRAAVEAGYTDGRRILADLYADGIGVAVDVDRAVQLYLLADQDRDPKAATTLGQWLLRVDDALDRPTRGKLDLALTDRGRPKTVEYWLERGTRFGSAAAYEAYAEWIAREDKPERRELWLRTLGRAAAAGDADARARLGELMDEELRWEGRPGSLSYEFALACVRGGHLPPEFDPRRLFREGLERAHPAAIYGSTYFADVFALGLSEAELLQAAQREPRLAVVLAEQREPALRARSLLGFQQPMPEAVETLTRLAPSDPEARRALGVTFSKDGPWHDPAFARSAFEQAIASGHQGARVDYARALLRRRLDAAMDAGVSSYELARAQLQAALDAGELEARAFVLWERTQRSGDLDALKLKVDEAALVGTAYDQWWARARSKTILQDQDPMVGMALIEPLVRAGRADEAVEAYLTVREVVRWLEQHAPQALLYRDASREFTELYARLVKGRDRRADWARHASLIFWEEGKYWREDAIPELIAPLERLADGGSRGAEDRLVRSLAYLPAAPELQGRVIAINTKIFRDGRPEGLARIVEYLYVLHGGLQPKDREAIAKLYGDGRDLQGPEAAFLRGLLGETGFLPATDVLLEYRRAMLSGSREAALRLDNLPGPDARLVRMLPGLGGRLPEPWVSPNAYFEALSDALAEVQRDDIRRLAAGAIDEMAARHEAANWCLVLGQLRAGAFAGALERFERVAADRRLEVTERAWLLERLRAALPAGGYARESRRLKELESELGTEFVALVDEAYAQGRVLSGAAASLLLGPTVFPADERVLSLVPRALDVLDAAALEVAVQLQNRVDRAAFGDVDLAYPPLAAMFLGRERWAAIGREPASAARMPALVATTEQLTVDALRTSTSRRKAPTVEAETRIDWTGEIQAWRARLETLQAQADRARAVIGLRREEPRPGIALLDAASATYREFLDDYRTLVHRPFDPEHEISILQWRGPPAPVRRDYQVELPKRLGEHDVHLHGVLGLTPYFALPARSSAPTEGFRVEVPWRTGAIFPAVPEAEGPDYAEIYAEQVRPLILRDEQAELAKAFRNAVGIEALAFLQRERERVLGEHGARIGLGDLTRLLDREGDPDQLERDWWWNFFASVPGLISPRGTLPFEPPASERLPGYEPWL